MPEIPSDKQLRLEYFKKEYETRAATGASAMQIMSDIERTHKGMVSVRTLWRYKEKWEPARPKKPKPERPPPPPEQPNKQPQRVVREKEPAKRLTWTASTPEKYKPNDNHDPETKRKVITEVCNEYGQGDNQLTTILDRVGLSMWLFNTWIGEDEQLYVLFKKSEELHNSSYYQRISEGMKNMVATHMGDKMQEEISITYEYQKQIDESGTEIVLVEVPVSKTVRQRRAKPDAAIIKTIIDAMKDMRLAQMSKDNEDIQRLLAMSETELDEELLAMVKERERRTPNEQLGDADNSTVGDTNQDSEVPKDTEDEAGGADDPLQQ